jgi:hypothetical protein
VCSHMGGESLGDGMVEPHRRRRAPTDDYIVVTGPTFGEPDVLRVAAMTVGYDVRPSTQDVDWTWRPSTEVQTAPHRSPPPR